MQIIKHRSYSFNNTKEAKKTAKQHCWYNWQAPKCTVNFQDFNMSFDKSLWFWGCMVFVSHFAFMWALVAHWRPLMVDWRRCFHDIDPWVRLSASRILFLLLHFLMNWPEKIQRTIQNGSPRLNWSIIMKAQSIHDLILHILWNACL